MAAICLLVGFAFGPPLLAKPLRAWNLLPQDESLTELYFSDYRKLPTTLLVGQAVRFSFVVHNFEHQAVPYGYVVTVSGDDKEIELHRGSFTIGHNQSKQTIEEVIMHHPSASARVTITLTYDTAAGRQTHAIHHWLKVHDVSEGES